MIFCGVFWGKFCRLQRVKNRKKTKSKGRLVLQMFGTRGTPYLALISTGLCLFGGFLCLCRPVIISTGGPKMFGSRATYGTSSGSTFMGGECGQGGSIPVLAGMVLLIIGAFLFLVSYRVTKEKEEES